jgi:hypothetical protein
MYTNCFWHEHFSPFDIVIQNDHIIEQNQLFAAILPRAAGNKHVLSSVYRTRLVKKDLLYFLYIDYYFT